MQQGILAQLQKKGMKDLLPPLAQVAQVFLQQQYNFKQHLVPGTYFQPCCTY